MEMSEKRCPVCGAKVVGRSDKKYCCDECRVEAGNKRIRLKRVEKQKSETLYRIEQTLQILNNEKGKRYLKIIGAVTQFCKILYKFGV